MTISSLAMTAAEVMVPLPGLEVRRLLLPPYLIRFDRVSTEMGARLPIYG
jgi:hypothetical protein